MDWVISSILISTAVFIVAFRSGDSTAWYAWIPFRNLLLLSEMADSGIFSFVLLFVPIVNVFVYIWMWMRIADFANKSMWLGLLSIVPVVNIALAWYITLEEPRPARY